MQLMQLDSNLGRMCHYSALVVLLAVGVLSQRTLAQSYILAPTATPISPGQSVLIDSTAATFSELGWDLSYRDHSASTGVSLYTIAHGGSLSTATGNAPYVTTVGGANVAGIITRQPGELTDFDIGISLAANTPTRVTLWVDTTLTSSFVARLADDSATLAPIIFSVPTKFELTVNSTVKQSLFVTSTKSLDGRVGLWATAASAAVPEPTTLVLMMLAAAGWCVWRGRAG